MILSEHLLSDKQLLDIFNLTKTATAIHVGEDAVIQTANDAMLKIWGKDRSVIGRSLEDALPELKGQPFIGMFAKVWREGLIISGSDTAADLNINGVVQTFYFDFEYRAIKNDTGKTICILHTATDVTERVLNRETLERAHEKEEALAREQALNEELAASNEELNAVNEELQQTQETLYEVNNDLEQRVASRVIALNQSEQKLQQILSHLPAPVVVLGGPDQIVETTNDALLSFWNKTTDEVLGKPMLEIFPELKDQPFPALWKNVFETGNVITKYERPVKFLQSDGSKKLYYVDFHYQPLTDIAGNITGVLATVIDVTDKVLSRNLVEKSKAELQSINEELEASNEKLAITNEELAQTHINLKQLVTRLSESEEKLRQALETGKIGTWNVDLLTDNLNISESARVIHGLHLSKPLTLTESFDLIDPAYREQIINRINEAVAKNESFNETYIIHPDNGGKLKWLKSIGKAYYDSNNNPAYITGTMFDITEQKEDEQRKNDFIGMVSHELKTPLTSLNAYVQMLQQKAKKTEDAFTAAALAKAKKQVNKMTSMINGFLNVSRLESGKIYIDKQRFDMAALIREVEDDTVSAITTHKIIFAPVEPTFVNADQEKIGQVINNLISNAVKYSDGGTTVQVACLTVNGSAHVSVKDQGIGIRPEDQEKLFERFYRVESNHTVSGFGIGLYLSAEIIQRHEGTIAVESEPGKGSAFYFTLPLA